MKIESRVLRCGLLGLALLSGGRAMADADIATAPLFTTATSQVKPNVLFVLDDSGSMAWDYLPDDASFAIPAKNSNGVVEYGRRAAHCNGVAFDNDTRATGASPKPTYDPPLKDDGTPYDNYSTSFLSGGNARTGTFNQRTVSQSSRTIVSSGDVTLTVNVSSKQTAWYPVGSIVTIFDNSLLSTGANYMVGTVKSWDSGTGSITITVQVSAGTGTLSTVTIGDGSPVLNYYYTHSSGSAGALNYVYNPKVDTSSTFYKECNSVIGSSPGSGVFTLHFVTASSPEAQAYANWYAYYRTRILMMQTAVSRAFKTVNSDFRVGFTTISNTGVTAGNTFLDVNDFGSSQKTSFYTKLMAASPGGSTPLRGALSKAGRYFAKKVFGQTYDPVQYSCQKNFTILSTDGYWNTDDEVNNSTAALNYGPYGFDNLATVDQQDGGATPRPKYDGGTSTVTTVNKWNVVTTYDSTAVTPRSSETKAVRTVVQTATTPQSQTVYTVSAVNASVSNSTITRCSSGSSPCTMTVTTSANHGYLTGSLVTISGSSVAAVNGTFTVTKTGPKTFTFVLASRPSSVNTAGTSSVGANSVSCSNTQAQQIAQAQTNTKTVTTTTTTTTYTDTTIAPLVQTTHYKSTTPYTETIIVTNGIENTHSPVAGTTSNSTPVVDAATTGAAPYPAGPVTPNPAGTQTTSTSTPNWTNNGAAVVSCVSSAAAKVTPGSTGTISDADGATTTTTTDNTNTTGPTTLQGTATTTTTTPVATAGTVTGTTTSTSSGGSKNSLADVAMYYYKNTLRTKDLGNCDGAITGKTLCDINQPVVPFGDDTATWLHMSTYTLSLGNRGTLLPADFQQIKGGGLNWPVPSSDAGAVNIDDLWHAAVNGGGSYFSASDPASLANSLNSVLNTIQSIKGSASAAATSTLQPVQGDNGAFIAQFQSQDWTGDLKAYAMDVKTGQVPTTTKNANGDPVDLKMWSAADMLQARTTARSIYYFRPSSTAGSYTGTLQNFVYDATNMTADEKAFFDNACDKTPALTQCTGLTSDQKVPLNSGTNMVNFLRGQVQTQYRTPKMILGDIVNASPVYVSRPAFNYTENGYASFKADQASRSPTVYVGANDGMLHAFNAETQIDASTKEAKATANSGTERWAYVPRLVMANLYKLADSFYASKHQYYVDATPATGDVYDATAGKWKTILVGGLNAGGRGYYALDITDPTTPKAMWEFSDSSKMGLTFGNPVITKRKDGTWIVAVTSGYNNSDGGGHLFVLDALTGKPLTTIDTGAGSAGSSSGLNKLNAWVDSDTENLAKRFYAGDLLGNVWRFDIDGYQAPKNAALAIAQLLDGSGVAQPITTIPQLGEVNANGGTWPVVYVGTGRYLGAGDVATTSTQSIYAIKDSLLATGIGNARSTGAKLVKQAVTGDTSTRTVGDVSTPVNWASDNGWYVDLLTGGERINVDMELSFDTLTAASNLPSNVATDCTPAGQGKSWRYEINIMTGGGTATAMSSMIAGLSSVQLSDGNGVIIVTKTDATTPDSVPINVKSQPGKTVHRTSWRELVD